MGQSDSIVTAGQDVLSSLALDDGSTRVLTARQYPCRSDVRVAQELGRHKLVISRRLAVAEDRGQLR